jgi:hypothetical protein
MWVSIQPGMTVRPVRIVVGLAAVGTDRHDPAAFNYDALILENRTLPSRSLPVWSTARSCEKAAKAGNPRMSKRILQIVSGAAAFRLCVRARRSK